MKQDTFLRDIARTFTLPMTGKHGIKGLLVGLGFSLIPFGSFVCRGAAYSLHSDGSGSIKKWAKTGAKMAVGEMVLAAPLLFWYALFSLLHTYFLALPFWLNVGFILLMSYFAVRAAMLLPAVLGSVALGMPLRQAVKPRMAKRVVKSCFGRYMLSVLICLVYALLLERLAQSPYDIFGWILAALYNTVFNFLTAGLFTASCRKAFGIAPPADPPKTPRAPKAVQAAALLLAVSVGANAFSVPVEAMGGIYGDENQPIYSPGDAAAGGKTSIKEPQSYEEARRLYGGMGLLDNGAMVTSYTDENGKTHYGVEDRKTFEQAKQMFKQSGDSRQLKDLAIDTVDGITTILPATGFAKSVAQIPYYGYLLSKAETDEEKKKLMYNLGWAITGTATGGISNLIQSGGKIGTKIIANLSGDTLLKIKYYNDIIGAWDKVQATETILYGGEENHENKTGTQNIFEKSGLDEAIRVAYGGLVKSAEKGKEFIKAYNELSFIDKEDPVGTYSYYSDPSKGRTYVGVYNGKLDSSEYSVKAEGAEINLDYSENSIRMEISESGLAQIKILVNGKMTSSYAGVASVNVDQKFDLMRAMVEPDNTHTDPASKRTDLLEYTFACVGNSYTNYSYAGDGFEGGGGTGSKAIPVSATVKVRVELTEKKGYIAKGTIEFDGADAAQYTGGVPLTFTLGDDGETEETKLMWVLASDPETFSGHSSSWYDCTAGGDALEHWAKIRSGKNGSVNMTFTCSKPPKIIDPDKYVTFTLTAAGTLEGEVAMNNVYDRIEGYAYIKNFSSGEIFEAEAAGAPYRAVFETMSDKGGEAENVGKVTVTGRLPISERSEEGDTKTIRFVSTGYVTAWTYTLKMVDPSQLEKAQSAQ